MKKRLRRKLKVKEFAEYGCKITGKFHDSTSFETMDSFLNALCDLCEYYSLFCCGGTNKEKTFDFIIYKQNYLDKSRKYANQMIMLDYVVLKHLLESEKTIESFKIDTENPININK